MENENIKFGKERDFGQILNATFSFLRQEFKPLIKALIYYAGPFILMQTIVVVYLQSQGFDILSIIYGGFNELPSDLILTLVLNELFSALGYAMFISVTYGYFKLYKEKGKGGFELSEVWTEANKYFFKVLGVNILMGIIIGVGFALIIIPGIYLGVSLCLIFTIMFFENKSFGESFSRSFQLTKVQWWWTLLLLIVVFLITGIIGFIFQIPATIISEIYEFNSTSAFAGSSGGLDTMQTLLLIFNGISTVASIFLYAIPLTALAFQYFNIIEISESPTLNQKIEEINTDN